MTPKDPPDEIQSSRPDVIQWWLSGEHQLSPPYLPMEDRMIHRYFSEQPPFFDWTTNNGIYLAQSRTNRQQFDIAHNRQLFEDTLRRQQGVEYMITGEPVKVEGGGGWAGTGTTGVWNLRKQERRKVRDGSGRVQDELEVLGTYYIVGENVYQAPSVGDVVGNRLLAATASLDKFYERASALPYWSPTLGHRYLLPGEAKQSSGGDKTASATASPGRSREGSVMAGVETQSLRSGSVVPEGAAQGANVQGSEVEDAKLLWDSLNKAISYQDEYMDENPIVGEPGHLSFTSTAAAVKKRKAEEEAAATKAREQKEARSRASSPAIKVEKAPSPPAVMTESKTGGKSDKDRKARAEKAKRRKSRTNAQTPITPGSATVAPTPTSAT